MIFLLTKRYHSNNMFKSNKHMVMLMFCIIANQSLQAPTKEMLNKYLETVSWKGRALLASLGHLFYSSLLTPSCLL